MSAARSLVPALLLALAVPALVAACNDSRPIIPGFDLDGGGGAATTTPGDTGGAGGGDTGDAGDAATEGG